MLQREQKKTIGQEARRSQRLTGNGSEEAKGAADRDRSRKKIAEHRLPRLNGALPAAYGETRIVLLPIDPYLLHVYWEVSDSEMGYVKALVEEGALRPKAVLRFHDVTALPLGGVRAAGSFDVEIHIESRNWYVRLLSPERSYVVDLGFRGTDGRFHRIARSNRAETPRAWPCAEAGEQRMRVVDVDGVVHVDPVEQAPPVHDPEPVSEYSEERPRIEMRMPTQERRAMVGVAGTPVADAEADKGRQSRPVHGPTEPPWEPGFQKSMVESDVGDVEPVRPVRVHSRRPPPPWNPRPVDSSEHTRSKLAAIYGRKEEFPPRKRMARVEAPAIETGGRFEGPRIKGGPRVEMPPEGQVSADIDLSLLCEHLFLSGLSSSRIAAAEKEDPNDEG